MDQPWHRATNPDEDDNTMNCGFERIQPCEEWRGRAKEASARGSGGKAARAPTGRNEANVPSPATRACAEAITKQAGEPDDRDGAA